MKGGARFFFAPDNAVGSGNPGANQAGAQEQTTEGTVSDPLSRIDLDDLDPETRKIIEEGRTVIATAQKQAADERAAREKAIQESRKFQAGYDSLKAKLDRINPDPNFPSDPKQKLVDQFTKTLISKGVSEDQAKIQAPLMLELMDAHGEHLKASIGRDLAPLAGSVMLREAQTAWHEAVANDPFAALQNPEVATKTWEQVQELTNAGQSITVETVKNLRNMFYMEHLEKTGTPMPAPQFTPQPPAGPRYPSVGGLGYGGGAPVRPVVTDPNAPRYSLDASTAAALAKINQIWGKKK